MQPLLDTLGRPLRQLRISVTDRCNFRCQYCMPASVFGTDYPFLQRKDMLSLTEIVRLARIFTQLGVDKIRLTGGEPLVRPGVVELVQQLKAVPGIREVTMTTNGSLLPRHAADLKAAGLDRLNISLDSLDSNTFEQMNGNRGTVDQILDGITAAEEAGFTHTKINAVAQRSANDATILKLARYFHDRGHTLRFIEYMDVGTSNNWKQDDVIPAQEIVDRIHAVMPLEPVAATHAGDVSRRYRYLDGKGEVGFITSVSEPFCAQCNRLRLSADGKLLTCLFTSIGHDLRSHLRAGETDAELADFMRGIWQARDDRYSELRAEQGPQAHKVEMSYVGG